MSLYQLDGFFQIPTLGPYSFYQEIAKTKKYE